MRFAAWNQAKTGFLRKRSPAIRHRKKRAYFVRPAKLGIRQCDVSRGAGSGAAAGDLGLLSWWRFLPGGLVLALGSEFFEKKAARGC
jgi:hypothetical protein